VCEEANKIRLREYKWKKDLDEVKKDSKKDIHPLALQMLMNASSSNSK
jgi:hypothetical protein